MSYSIEKLPDEPVILISFHADFDPQADMPRLYEERTALLNAQAEPMFVITDVHLSNPDFDGIMAVASTARADVPANLREHLIVTDSAVIKMATQGLDSDVFKHRKMPVFSSVDEALAYVHQQLKNT